MIEVFDFVLIDKKFLLRIIYYIGVLFGLFKKWIVFIDG